MTEQEIQQGIEELEEAIKTYGFCEDKNDLPKFPHHVCDLVAQAHGYERTVVLYYYGVRYGDE